ncbi:MAG: DUF3108 domain-containing protein [candidate division Zixibacteria bacterium]|nr:DUF3108 domain-containing protein [candidate division Zixibacteria bacterium]
MIKLSIITTAAFMLLCLFRFALADDSTYADTVQNLQIENTDSITPPDSAYIARASDSSWWRRKIDNRAFNVGEYLEFGVSYGIIPAGTAAFQIPEIIEYNGQKCYKVISTARTNAFVSTFYKVDDTVFSYIDYDGVFSLYFRKRLREGGYKADKQTIYDQRRHLAITGNDTIPTYPFVQDVFSSFYYVRTQDVMPGKDILIDNHTGKKNYPLKVIVRGKETIKVPAGEFDCVIVEPVMRAEGIFKAKGKIKIWLTDDRYKMPVKMQTEVFFLGSVTAKLRKFSYGEFPDDTLIINNE